ncbi:MAG: hypothetical protein LBM74_08470 [Oscillospiraceae bacterium]|jgi:hypothetical protein|nr:hypothetical protein [Oscillospiraceae bacterium]
MRTEQDIAEEKHLSILMEQYRARYGDGSTLPLWVAPAELTFTDRLIALYEQCLREGKPWEAYVTLPDIPPGVII